MQVSVRIDCRATTTPRKATTPHPTTTWHRPTGHAAARACLRATQQDPRALVSTAATLLATAAAASKINIVAARTATRRLATAATVLCIQPILD